MRLLGKLMAVTLVLMTGAMLVMAAAGLIYLTHSRSYVAVPAVESWAGSQPLGSAHVEVAPGVYQAWPVVATAVNALPLLIVFSSFLLVLAFGAFWRWAGRRRPADDREEQLMQELYRRSVKMEERLEALETLLLQQRTETRADWTAHR